MNYRERFAKTISHLKADRVPVDFCGTTLTGCHPAVIKELAGYFSISASDIYSAEEQIQRRFGCDFRRVGCLFEPESNYLDKSRISQGIYTDSWGITRKDHGLYWDIVQNPFKNLDLADITGYQWPSVSGISKKTIRDLKEKAKQLYYDTDYVVVGEHPVYGFFELGCWMFGYEDFLYRIIAEPETTSWFFNKFYSYVKDINELYYSAVGEYIHLTTSGDDFGMQNGPFMSPDTFRKTIKPWYEKRIKDVKQYTNAKYFHHSCGSVYRLIGDIADMGVDILNPVQPGAFEMEPERLKADYGDRMIFWGGIDEQNLLSHGKTEQVRSEVKRIIGVMNVNGGYILSASHNIQPDVPAENIITMFSAALN